MKRALLTIGVFAALGAIGWGVWAAGPESIGGPTRVELGDGPLARLDTIALERRIVTASIVGTVVENENDLDVLVTDGESAVTVRLKEDHGITQGATLLARGRVREVPDAPRRLHAVSWVEVESSLLPSFDGPDSIRIQPDSARFGTESDRSPKGSDRSAE